MLARAASPAVRRIAGAAIVLAAVSVVLGERNGRAGAEPPAPVLLVTRDIRGHLEPCECKDGVLGGFPRRATVVRETRPALLVDAGDMVYQAAPFDLLRYRLMLELSVEMGLDAGLIGRREAGFSADELVRVATDTGAPLVATNLRRTNLQPFLPTKIRIERMGRPITILGLLSARAPLGEGLKLVDPRYALETQLDILRDKPDFVILLSALDARETERVLDGLEGVDLIVGGAVPRGTEKLETLAGVPCFLVEGKGQYLGRVDFDTSGERLVPVAGRRVPLGPEVAADPAVDRRIRAFQRSLEGLDLLGKRERKDGESPYLGAARHVLRSTQRSTATIRSRHTRTRSTRSRSTGAPSPRASWARRPGQGCGVCP